MKLSRHSLMAAVMMASGLVFTLFGSAYAQRATYRASRSQEREKDPDCRNIRIHL